MITPEQLALHRLESERIGRENAWLIIQVLSLTEPKTRAQLAALAGITHGQAESGQKYLQRRGYVVEHKLEGCKGYTLVKKVTLK